MYFIKMEVTTADALYNFGLKQPKVVPYIGEALCNAVLICSAVRAGSKTNLKKEPYLNELQRRVKTLTNDETANAFIALVADMFDEVHLRLDEVAIRHECKPMEYKLFKKERGTIYIVRVK